jgi:hypothetical protein
LPKKPPYLRDQAEKLYVVGGLNQREICDRLKLNRSTVRKWKKLGNWEEKRGQFIENKKAFHEELYEFARKLLRSVSQDLEAGNKVDFGRMYTLNSILPKIVKVKEYEDIRKEREAQGQKETKINPEFIQNIMKDIYGI